MEPADASLRCTSCGASWRESDLINYGSRAEGEVRLLCQKCRPLKGDEVLPPGSLHPGLKAKAKEMSHRWNQFLKTLEGESSS